jgi:hypothetical protein
MIKKLKIKGKWLGQLPDGKKGLFPFNRVEILDNLPTSS